MLGYDVPKYTNVVMPFLEQPPNVPEENPTGIYRRSFSIPRGVGRATRRARLRRRRGRAARPAERTPGRHREGLAHACRVRRHRPRPPRRPQRARRRRRTLVGRELRRGPGPVVACRHLARRERLGGAASIRDVFARAEADGRLTVDASTAPARSRPRSSTRRGRVVLSERFSERLEARVRAPRLWSAEEPALYTLVRELTGTRRSRCRVGFRTVEIRDGRLLLNGKPLLIRGVNRHEHDDRHGRVVSRELMETDAALMKRVERQRRAHVALPERPLLARPLRPLRALRRSTRRTSSRTPSTTSSATTRRYAGAFLERDAQHGRARQEPSERHLLVARQRERLRPESRRGCRLDPRPRPVAAAPLRGRDQGRLGGRAPRDGHRLPDVPRARRDRGRGPRRARTPGP